MNENIRSAAEEMSARFDPYRLALWWRAEKSRADSASRRVLELSAQRDKLREALATSMRYFDQVIAETGYQSEGERIAHQNARAALAEMEDES